MQSATAEPDSQRCLREISEGAEIRADERNTTSFEMNTVVTNGEAKQPSRTFAVSGCRSPQVRQIPIGLQRPGAPRPMRQYMTTTGSKVSWLAA
ncbi:hypothetical protein [Bradyrhizobium tropiciagri]|uniref:hypothetical protein n=1 Tax=Bradyrhizobium tropiciagri TaxID=312253 RepID=UPI0012FE9D83|nr:hypothetical protein [Bradyrhizobium tropiciagri]